MDLRLSKRVRKIVLLSGDGGDAEVIYKAKKKKRKKGTTALRRIEKRFRRTGRGNRKGAAEYWRRHNKSNRKRKDGWCRDLVYNFYKANRRRGKVLKTSSW